MNPTEGELKILNAKKEYMRKHLRDIYPDPSAPNYYYGKAFESDEFDNFHIAHSHVPDVDRFAKAAIDTVISAVYDLPRLLELDTDQFEDLDSYCDAIDDVYPISKTFHENNIDYSPWTLPQEDFEAAPIRCAPATIESAWVHTIVADVMEYLSRDETTIVQCLDCKDAYDTLKKLMPSYYSKRIYYEDMGPVKAKIGLLILSYYSDKCMDWVRNCDAFMALTWSQHYISTKGKNYMMNYVDDVSSTWASQLKGKSRWFRFFNQNLLRTLTYEDGRKDKKFQNLQYRPWTQIQNSIPELKTTPRLKNALKCFAVMIGFRNRPKKMINGAMKGFTYAGKGHRLAFDRCSDRNMLGFNISDVNMSDIGCLPPIASQKIVKYRIHMFGKSVVVAYSDGDEIYMSQNLYVDRPSGIGNDGNVLGFGILTVFGDWAGGLNKCMLEAVTVVYANMGPNHTFNSGCYPDWLYNHFDMAGVSIRLLSRDPGNTHVVNNFIHGSYIKVADWDELDKEYCTIIELDDTAHEMPFNGAPFIVLCSKDNTTVNRYRNTVGFF